MITPINFNNKTIIPTEEINYIVSYNILTKEIMSVNRACAKCIP